MFVANSNKLCTFGELLFKNGSQVKINNKSLIKHKEKNYHKDL